MAALVTGPIPDPASHLSRMCCCYLLRVFACTQPTAILVEMRSLIGNGTVPSCLVYRTGAGTHTVKSDSL